MDNKVNKHIHDSLEELYYECSTIVSDYDYNKRVLWTHDPKEYTLNSIDEQVEYIDKMLEVFQNAELITNEERRLCHYCAYRMQREANGLLRDHIRKESA